MTTPRLAVDGVSVRFGGLTAVDSVSLTIPPGEIRGLIGPNGAGKTTLFNAITGLVHTAAGRIRLDGADITRLPPHRRAREGVRRSFQSVQLLSRLSVLENVLLGLHGQIARGMLSSAADMLLGGRREAVALRQVMETLSYLGIADLALRPAASLTFAEQRFVEIARALAPRPRLLMLDEPAAGLSPSEVTRLDALLRQLRSEGMAILLVEHVLSLVFDVCDSVSVLDNGRLIAEGAPRAVAADPRVRIAYLGEDADALA
ncbi:MAG: ABC transporter ATP-binding protein [Acetobacteraceae bacterium]